MSLASKLRASRVCCTKVLHLVHSNSISGSTSVLISMASSCACALLPVAGVRGNWRNERSRSPISSTALHDPHVTAKFHRQVKVSTHAARSSWSPCRIRISSTTSAAPHCSTMPNSEAMPLKNAVPTSYCERSFKRALHTPPFPGLGQVYTSGKKRIILCKRALTEHMMGSTPGVGGSLPGFCIAHHHLFGGPENSSTGIRGGSVMGRGGGCGGARVVASTNGGEGLRGL
mmetsp:Transcript_34485/g.55801  ORF Transcript_34485/g.55801 Transcript_34485/m.55801 type:complete len:230 (+) Transcript_34485:470-1159(+)